MFGARGDAHHTTDKYKHDVKQAISLLNLLAQPRALTPLRRYISAVRCAARKATHG